MALYRFAVGRQHSAEHPKLANRAAELRNAEVDILERNQGNAFESWTPV